MRELTLRNSHLKVIESAVFVVFFADRTLEPGLHERLTWGTMPLNGKDQVGKWVEVRQEGGHMVVTPALPLGMRVEMLDVFFPIDRCHFHESFLKVVGWAVR
jgi:hypothetical protein